MRPAAIVVMCVFAAIAYGIVHDRSRPKCREKSTRDTLADLWAHNASYATGLIGGVIVMVRVWRSRFTPL